MAGREAPGAMSIFARQHGLLESTDFLKLWGAQVFVKIAENFFNFSLVILLFQRSGSTFLVSVYVALVSVPPILFSGIAGVVADSFNRKTVLLVSNALRIGLVAAALLSQESPIALIVIAFLLSVLAQFFSPAEVSSIPSLVPKDNLFAANSLYTFTNYAAFLIGYTLAGPSLHRLNATPTFLITAAFYGIALMFNFLLPPLDHHLKHLLIFKMEMVRNGKEFFRRFRDGIRFIARHRILLVIILQVATVFSIERAVISVIPSFSESFLGFTIEDLSLFLILPTGIGTIAGVLIANRLKRRVPKNRLITFGLALDSGALLALAAFPWFQATLGNVLSAALAGKAIVILLSFLSGAADPFIIVPAQTALHERAPEEERGRVFGALYTIMNAIGIVPVLLIGYLSDFVSLAVIFCILAGAIFFAMLMGIPHYRREPLGTEG